MASPDPPATTPYFGLSGGEPCPLGKVLGLFGLEEEDMKFALIRSGVNSDREVRRSRKSRRKNRGRRVRGIRGEGTRGGPFPAPFGRGGGQGGREEQGVHGGGVSRSRVA